MGELRPLAADLNQECRAFADALRALFVGLDVSVRRYGARRFISPGTVSRYLSGTRIPPWEFVLDLLTDVAEHRGVPATSEAIDLLRELHRAAMRTSASMSHTVQRLQFQLAEADREARGSAAQADVIGEALLDRNHRIADLEVRINQLEAEWAAERAHAALCIRDRETLLRERDTLASEVRRLTAELNEARARIAAAEARCELLECQLVAAERHGGTDALHLTDATGPPEPVGRPKILIVDDQQANLLALEAVLGAVAEEVVCALSGVEALKVLLQHDDIAVIILDAQMADMDGYETAAHIKRRARTRHIPIIFLTASGHDSSHQVRGYAAGAVDYLVKPFEPWLLQAKITALSDMYAALRRPRQPLQEAR
ncbi:response regulator [Streptomyces sp. NPDC092296]|uniref:response regulator n=1 Tax=Streptomyces sp. NPDC092296 TaxID=3366012 RepID=UPI00381DE648